MQQVKKISFLLPLLQLIILTTNGNNLQTNERILNGNKFECQDNLLNIFLDSESKIIGREQKETVAIDMICNSNFEADNNSKEPNKKRNTYCCHPEEFKSLLDQFYAISKRLEIIRSKVNQVFRFMKNIKDSEFAKLTQATQDPKNKACMDPNMEFNFSGNRKSMFSQGIKLMNKFIDWKQAQIEKMPCFICSPHKSMNFSSNLNTLEFSLSNMTCVEHLEEITKMDLVIYNFTYLISMARFLRCSSGKPTVHELEYVQNLKEIEPIKKARNLCASRSKNNLEEKNCKDLVKEGIQPMFFGYYRDLKIYSEIMMDEFSEFFVKQSNSQLSPEEVKLIEKEEKIIEMESVAELAKIEFTAFRNFSGLKGKKTLFYFKCSPGGSVIKHFSINKGFLYKFEGAVVEHQKAENEYYENLQKLWEARKRKETQNQVDGLSNQDIKSIHSQVNLEEEHIRLDDASSVMKLSQKEIFNQLDQRNSTKKKKIFTEFKVDMNDVRSINLEQLPEDHYLRLNQPAKQKVKHILQVKQQDERKKAESQKLSFIFISLLLFLFGLD